MFPTDQSDDGGIDVEAEEPALGVWENGFEGAGDDFECGEVYLVEREPLTEEAVVGEAVADGLEMLASVEEACTVLGGMKEVGDDDAVTVGGGADEAAAIGDVDEIGGLERGGIVEERHDAGNFGDEFDAVGEEIRIISGGGEADAGAETDEEGAFWFWMEEEGDISLALFGDARGGAAHLEAVIEFEDPRIGAFENSCAFNDRDRTDHTFLKRDETASAGGVNKFAI